MTVFDPSDPSLDVESPALFQGKSRPSGSSVETNIRRLSVGTLLIFVVVLAAFFWVERRLARSLTLNQEVVVPARDAAEEVDRALGELLVRQSRIAGASNLEQVEAVADRTEEETALKRVRSDVERVSAQLIEEGADIEEGYGARFGQTFESFLASDRAFLEANQLKHRQARALTASIAGMERELKVFLESASGISGKMQFEYGSAIRGIKRRLKAEGWSASVRQQVSNKVLASSSRRNMIVGDVLSLASEMNRLAGKVGLTANQDQLRSLYANELVPTRDRLALALEELRFETKGEGEIAVIAKGLEETLARLAPRVMDRESRESLVSMKQTLMASETESARLQTELGVMAHQATDLSQSLVGAAEAQSRAFDEGLRSAGATARWLLLGAIAAVLVGGILGLRSVRSSIDVLHETNEDLTRLKDELTDLNRSLEAKVEERTAALDSRNKAMRVVLDNVEQGLVTLDGDGNLESERSARFRDWFGRAESGTNFGDLLARLDDKAGTFFKMGWDEVKDGFMPLEVTLAQLPRKLSVGDRNLALDYRAVAMNDDVVERALMVATDVTEQLERQRAEAAEREFMQVFRHLMKDRASFVDFFEEAASIVRRLEELDRENDADYNGMFRAIHTLKGNCALFGLERMAEICHDVETRMVEEQSLPSAADCETIFSVWSETTDRVGQLLDDGSQARVQLDLEELQGFIEEGWAFGLPASMMSRLESWRHETVEGRLDRLADQAKALAVRLNKGDIAVNTSGGQYRLPRAKMAAFWASLAHVVRNAVDHGLERPDDRVAAGKPPQGSLELGVRGEDDELCIIVSDDGAGVSWERVEAKAAEKGLPHASQDDLVAALFCDGLSSKASVSSVSGRGVGLSAARAATERLGGRVVVVSAVGEGTSFEFRIPYASLAEVPLVEQPSLSTGTLDLSH